MNELEQRKTLLEELSYIKDRNNNLKLQNKQLQEKLAVLYLYLSQKENISAQENIKANICKIRELAADIGINVEFYCRTLIDSLDENNLDDLELLTAAKQILKEGE